MAHEIGKEAITITRHQLIQCMLAINALSERDEDGKPLNKWARLRDDLRKRLDEHDAKAAEKGWRD